MQYTVCGDAAQPRSAPDRGSRCSLRPVSASVGKTLSVSDGDAAAESPLQFSASQAALNKLAAEARSERAAGRATELDPDKL